MGRAESDIVKELDNENYRKVHVQWWVPLKKGVKNDDLYCIIVIVGLISGNVILETQNNGLTFCLCCFLLLLKAMQQLIVL
jgi:hypothetical protein